MLGSSNSIACANIMLNSAVAEILQEFADKLEESTDFDTDLHELIKDTIKEHRRIIFNGNGYGDEWMAEAEKRGLSNLKTTADCMPKLLDKKNADMLIKQSVFTKAELESRCDIMLENYVKAVNIEALTMADIQKKFCLLLRLMFIIGKDSFAQKGIIRKHFVTIRKRCYLKAFVNG